MRQPSVPTTPTDNPVMNISPSPVIRPPATIAILGGGQLGSMLAHAARHMGYRTLCISSNTDDPAARWADHHLAADPGDANVISRIAADVQAITVETESIEPAALAAAEAIGTRVAPSSHVQTIVRDRRLEKSFLASNHLSVGPFRIVESAAQMQHTAQELFGNGAKEILAKTARGGYDGKGQRWIRTPGQADAAWQALGQVPLVVETRVDFVGEISVIVARSPDGSMSTLPVFANEHRHGILFQTRMPAALSPATTHAAVNLARRTAQHLNVVGLLAVEMFVLPDGRVLVNEMAARPHNSGHVTLRAATRSQFEMHIAAICGLPLPEVEILRPAVMTNLLGDLWPVESPPAATSDGGHRHPDWATVLADGRATLHLYGKTPRQGRKMGHLIHTGHTAEEALASATAAINQLQTHHASEPA